MDGHGGVLPTGPADMKAQLWSVRMGSQRYRARTPGACRCSAYNLSDDWNGRYPGLKYDWHSKSTNQITSIGVTWTRMHDCMGNGPYWDSDLSNDEVRLDRWPGHEKAFTKSSRPDCEDVFNLTVRNPLLPCKKRIKTQNLSRHEIVVRFGYGVPVIV